LSEARPAELNDAATVILARQSGPSTLECFMVRRHVNSDFAPDVYVFPGGKVDPGDRDPELLRYLDDRPAAKTEVDFVDDDWGFRMAALRELFEEAGVLLATGPDGNTVKVDREPAGAFDGYRRGLHAGDISLATLAQQAKILYAPKLLAAFSHWITPLSFPRRYNTRFFVATMPEGQKPLHDAVETTHGIWIAPAEALRRYEEGDFPLVFATIKQLERMSLFQRLTDMVQATRPSDLDPVMPRPIERAGETDFLLPWDEGYAEA
jgi:8-oxo-dGTP pyrophosphatase MutT (NUDIX family)